MNTTTNPESPTVTSAQHACQFRRYMYSTKGTFLKISFHITRWGRGVHNNNDDDGDGDNIKTWMWNNQLKPNEDKTEAVLLSTPLSSCHCLPSSVMVGTHEIGFSDKVRNLGFILDSNLTMKQHVIKICQTAYYEQNLISSIRRYLTDYAEKQVVTCSVLSRLDYCHSLLIGTPSSDSQPMQKVQNTAARLIIRAPRHQNCTPLLQ